MYAHSVRTDFDGGGCGGCLGIADIVLSGAALATTSTSAITDMLAMGTPSNNKASSVAGWQMAHGRLVESQRECRRHAAATDHRLDIRRRVVPNFESSASAHELADGSPKIVPAKFPATTDSEWLSLVDYDQRAAREPREWVLAAGERVYANEECHVFQIGQVEASLLSRGNKRECNASAAEPIAKRK